MGLSSASACQVNLSTVATPDRPVLAVYLVRTYFKVKRMVLGSGCCIALNTDH